MNNRIQRGFLWGVGATVAMTLMHIAILAVTAHLTVEAVTVRMLPEVIVARVLGSGLAIPVRVPLAALIHFGYGGFWGAVLSAMTPRITVWKGIAMGAFLYLIMQVMLLPLLGRGIFGSAIPHRGAASFIPSVLTHLTYGVTLGWFGARHTARSGREGRTREATAC